MTLAITNTPPPAPLDDDIEMLPTPDPIQSAIEQLHDFAALYRTRGEGTIRNPRHVGALLASVAGLVIAVTASIWIPLAIQNFSNSLPQEHIKNLLWKYFNDHTTQSWALNILNQMQTLSQNHKKIFMDGLTASCNDSALTFPMEFKPDTAFALKGLCFTISAHLLGLLSTWTISYTGFTTPRLSIREFLQFRKNLTILQQQVQIESRENAVNNTHSNLLIVSNEIFKKQKNKYIRIISVISMLFALVVLCREGWVEMKKLTDTSVGRFEKDPFQFQKYPSECHADYTIGFSGRSFIPISGAIPYIMNAPINDQDDWHAQAISIIAAGVFTALATPVLSCLHTFLSSLSQRYDLNVQDV